MTMVDEVRTLQAEQSADESYARRFEALREQVVGRERASGSFGVDELRVEEGATLRLHGDVNAGTTPHLEAVLDGIVSLSPTTLTVDLTRTTTVSLDALAAITRRAGEVGSLAVHLPSGPSGTLVDLFHSAGAGVREVAPA